MRIKLPHARVAVLAATVLITPLYAADTDATEDRMARLEARLLEMEARLADSEKNQPAPASTVSEQRIAELEARLAEAEQETKEVKVLAASGSQSVPTKGILGNTATYDILANSAWRNLRWTQEAQWEAVRPGVSVETVIDALGAPPRSVDSLKPRVDEVFYYETSIRADPNALRGKVSFRNGQVLTVQKPNFQ